GILLGIGHVQLAACVVNVERRKARGKGGVLKASRHRGGLKTAVEHVYRSCVKVGCVEQGPGGVRSRRESFIDGAARRIVDFQRTRRAAIPGRYSAVLRGEDEAGRLSIC